MSPVTLLLLTLACAPQDAGPWRPDGDAWTAALQGDQKVRVGANATNYGELTLRFVAWGRPDGLRAWGPAAPRLADCAGPCAPRVAQRHGGAEAWWQAAGGGVRQGWTLRERPEGAGPLLLITQVQGAIPTEIDGEIQLRGPQLTRVSGVAARDARGRALPAALFARGDALIVRIDDDGARWPLWVDPVYTTAGFVLAGPSANASFGSALGRVGDVNHDGFDDLAIGAKRVNKVYIHNGGEAGPSTTADQVLTGSGDFGASLDGALDFDCDGLDDLIVGAPAFNSSRGRVQLFQGTTTGLNTTALLSVDGPEPNAYAGFSLAGVDDFDDDGCDDIAIGAYGAGNDSGVVGLLYGAPGGPTIAEGITLATGSLGDALGYAVTGAGDLNGDGYGDVAIGACYANNDTGYFKVVLGAPGGVLTESTPIAGDESAVFLGCPIQSAGDVNGDGFDDLLVAAVQHDSFTGEAYLYAGSRGGLASTPSETLPGTSTNATMGSALGGEGDVNGDGLPDVIVGAMNDGGVGAAYLFHSDAAGLDAASPTTLTGTAIAGNFGSQAAIVGDVNGDGFDDVAVAAPGENNNAGAVYVYLGYADEDGDGVPASDDCDDTDPTLPVESYPDEDVDGYGDDTLVDTSCFVRAGWVTTGGDCDDSQRAVNPAANELPADDIDQNCDGIETCYVNADGDSHRSDNTIESANLECDGAGEALAAESGGDCDDADPTIYPAAPDTWYDGIDSDCAGDDDFDADRDGWPQNGDPADCDDTNPEVYPGAPDPPDALDRDCSGEVAASLHALSGGCPGCGGGAPAGVALLPLLLLLSRRQDPARNFSKPRPA